MLIVYGVLFIIIEKRNKSKKASVSQLEKISYTPDRAFIYNDKVIFYYHYSLRLFFALKN